MKNYLLIFAAVFFLQLTVSQSANAETNNESLAIETAEVFLQLIGNLEVEKAFDSTTEIFKDHKLKEL